MKFLLFIILAGCAVKCEKYGTYFIVEMEVDNTKDIKPFKVYWNVPTMQCASKKIPFENLYENYGIIQNKNDRFRGEKISILYDPGMFPAIFGSSGKYRFRNGGVPQEGDLDKHMESFRSILEQSIPDPNFDGVGIIDFESWRPVFRQNFGVLTPYKDVSFHIERKRHWIWPETWVREEAKIRFEESARKFMQTTLSVAKQMRPNAIWGYYGFPYCFNMATNNMNERCADKVPDENDQTAWLWAESTALYPSLYSSRGLSPTQLSQMIRGRVKESERVRRHSSPILPYFWFRYRDGGFLTEEDLRTALKSIYDTKASGLIIWGSSNDTNTVDKCVKLRSYMESVLGPAIAKYTKNIKKLQDQEDNHLDVTTTYENNNNINENNVYTSHCTDNSSCTTNNPLNEESITTNPKLELNVSTTAMPFKNLEADLADPEYNWNPPENYTHNLEKYVDEQLNKKLNMTRHIVYMTDTKSNGTKLTKFSENALVNIIRNSLSAVTNSSTHNTTTYRPENFIKNESGTTARTSSDIFDVTDGYYTQTNTHFTTDIPSTETTDYHMEGMPETFTNKDITDFPVNTEEISIIQKYNTGLYNDDNNYKNLFAKQSTSDDILDYVLTSTDLTIDIPKEDIDKYNKANEKIYPNEQHSSELVTTTTVTYELTTENYDFETSTQLNPNILKEFTKRIKSNNLSTADYSETTELYSNTYETSITDDYEETKFTVDVYDETNQNFILDSFFNLENFNSDEQLSKKRNVFTTTMLPDKYRQRRLPKDETTTDFDIDLSTEKYITIKAEEGNDVNKESSLNTNEKEDWVTLPTFEKLLNSTAQKQVAGSSHIIKPKYYFCVIFYFYSISKCLCNYFGQC